MDIEELVDYCSRKKGVTRDFPFDETTLCLRVGGKIFCITDTHDIPFRMNLKCDPERAVELREKWHQVIPGYHCNKKHWNTITPDLEFPNELLRELIDHSYNLIFMSLRKKDREAIENY